MTTSPKNGRRPQKKVEEDLKKKGRLLQKNKTEEALKKNENGR